MVSHRKMSHLNFHAMYFCICRTVQVVTDALVNPPRPGDPSYDLYHKEMSAIISSLRNKARLVHQRMNGIPGVQCNEIQGSMEAFPRVDIPHEAWDDARVRHTECWLLHIDLLLY